MVERSSIVENWRELNRFVAPAFSAAVIKANAYGLGAAEVGLALARAGCGLFFVARLAEGVRLRENFRAADLPSQPRIAVLDGYWSQTAGSFAGHDLLPVLSSREQLAWWLAELPSDHHERAILHFDTGMNRLGLAMGELAEVAEQSHSRRLRWWGLISHLACDDYPLDPLAERQRLRFEAVRRAIPHQRASLAASSGIGLGAEFHYDFVRPGIGLYGVVRPLFAAESAARNLAQHQSLRILARVCQNRLVDAGESVGYGATEVMEQGGRVAVVGLGYADFFPRNRLEGRSFTIKLGGDQVRPIGRVSMDLLSLDVSAVPEQSCRVGDWAEVVGEDNLLTDLADYTASSPYELLTRLGDRATRFYI